EGVGRMGLEVALSACGGFLGESGIDEPAAILAAQHPYEVVEVRSRLVRIGKDKALAGMTVAQMSVTDRDDFERFQFSQALSMAHRRPAVKRVSFATPF